MNKRDRCSNFTPDEMEKLLTLVENHRRFILSKKTDSQTNKEKDREWEKITLKFNAELGTDRTAKQVRSKWNCWKKLTKQQHLKQNRGSHSIKSGSILETKSQNWTERILSIVDSESTEPENDFEVDSDSILDSEIEVPAFQEEKPDIEHNLFEPKFEESIIQQEECEWVSCNSQPVGDTSAQPVLQPIRSGDPLEQRRENKKDSLYKALLEKKLELVQLQIDLLKKEHNANEKRKQEKHDAEMNLLRNKNLTW